MKTTKAHFKGQQKINHIANLMVFFALTEEQAIKLYKSLRLAECKLSRYFTVACERNLTETEEKLVNGIKERVKRLVNETEGLYFNHDPRGYAIKIDDKVIRDKGLRIYTDMGGYGILAPDFN